MSRQSVLITAASGIGDVLRITPLIRVFARLDYEVDVLLAPDFVEVVTLLEGAPEIRRLFYRPSQWSDDKQQDMDGLSREVYDLATFTMWSLPLQRFVTARRGLPFHRSRWMAGGDIACMKEIADSVGWSGDLPRPFAIPSKRYFGLRPETIALHPGCKLGWPWKKWHGFQALAELLPSVAIIGTPSDTNNSATYFGRPFSWPDHAMNFVGALSLQDTAALLRECAALVSNDSGLMHLGVALGIATFGIFGITSPDREAIPAVNMFSISKGLDCERACRQSNWAKRDCQYHLDCLKSLTAREVLDKVSKTIPLYQPTSFQ